MKKWEMLGIVLVVLLFGVGKYLSQEYSEFLKNSMVISGWKGKLAYAGLSMTAILIPPFTSLPLIPIAVEIWGVTTSAILAISGWWVGAIFVFVLVRQNGKPLIKKYEYKIMEVSFFGRKMTEISKRYDRRWDSFRGIVLLSMLSPPEFPACGLALLSNVSLKTYIPAVLVGITPFAFAFPYIATLDPIHGIIVILGIIFIITFLYWCLLKKQKPLE